MLPLNSIDIYIFKLVPKDLHTHTYTVGDSAAAFGAVPPLLVLCR